MRDSADRVSELRERERANSSIGLTMADRLHRLGDAARKMPDAMIEIFVSEWCARHRIDVMSLREARLVRAGGEP